MDNSVRKVTKKTTSAQFEVLVRQLEANPDLARGAPTFGAGRITVDDQWKKIAVKVNSYGPPQRSPMEWKKIWADLKSRTKKKIAEDNANIQETGGGPFQCAPLTEIEQAIDRVLLMSKAAAPSGKIVGFRSLQYSTQVATPPATHSTITQRTTAHTETENARTSHTITQQPTTEHPTTAHRTTEHPTTLYTPTEHSTTEHPTTSHPTTAQIVPIETDKTPTRQATTNTTLSPTRQPTQIGVVTPTRATPNSSNIVRSHQRRCFRKKKNFQEVIGVLAREQAKAAKEMTAASKMQAEATLSISESLAQLVRIATRQREAFEEFIKLMRNT